MSEKKRVAPRKKVWKDVMRLLVVALFFVGAALLLKNPVIRQQLFDIEVIRGELKGSGWRGVMLFIGIACLVNAIGIPRLWISAVAGTLFGAVEGTFCGLAATLAGSAINFFIGRSLLRGPIKRNMPQRMRLWYDAFNNNGFRAILYLRLFPLTNATLTNVLGGASRVGFGDYMLATAIGYLPFTVVFAILGSSAAKQNKWQLVAGLGLFTLVALCQWLWSRWKKRAGRIPATDILATGNDSDSMTGKEAV